MIRFLGKLQKRYAAFLHDLLMVPVAWLGSYWLRFNLDGIPVEFWRQALTVLPVVILAQGSMFWYFGLYRGVWRFASMPDLLRILKATLTGVAVAAVELARGCPCALRHRLSRLQAQKDSRQKKAKRLRARLNRSHLWGGLRNRNGMVDCTVSRARRDAARIAPSKM